MLFGSVSSKRQQKSAFFRLFGFFQKQLMDKVGEGASFAVSQVLDLFLQFFGNLKGNNLVAFHAGILSLRKNMIKYLKVAKGNIFILSI